MIETIALNLDIAPTILEAAGVEADPKMQGASLLGDASGDASPQRDGFFCEHRMKHPKLPRWEGYRTSRYKYARYLDVAENAEFLYDLETDPQELTNLAANNAQRPVLVRMRAQCSSFSDLYAAARPLPRVLLLGDSISMGYHEYVRDALADEATVVRPRENCAGTTKGVDKIDEWLTIVGGDFDVIHFNFGLHDLKRVTSEGRNSNDPGDPPQADLATYERNLREIVAALGATGATLIFATTTPVPSGGASGGASGGVRPHREAEDVARYNAAARRIMEENGIAVDDLYGFTLPRLAELQLPVNVHFTKDGSRQLGEEVTRHVRDACRRSSE